MRVIGLRGLLVAIFIARASAAVASPFAYVPNSNGGTVSVIDTETETVTATIPVASFVQAAAVHPDGTRAYVSSILTGTVYIIDAFTNTIATTIPAISPFGAGPMVFNPSATILYVLTTGVAVIDLSTNTVVTTITNPAFDNPTGLAITPDGAKIYVTNAFGGKIAIVDTASNTVTGSISTFGSTRSAEVLPDGSKVYIVEDSIGVHVVDPGTDTIVNTIPVTSPIHLALLPDGSKLYASTVSGVTVIDTATDTVVTSVPLGFLHFGVAAHPDGTRVYVPSQSTDEVFIVDTATNTSSLSIPVGSEPFARGKFIGPEFVCGNGTFEPGEECDDGNVANGDGCSSTCLLACDHAADPPKVVLTKQDTPAADDRLTFTGKVILPAAMPTLNPLATGVRVRLSDEAGTVVDATLPAGAFSGAGPGWTVNPAGNKWIYKDNTATPIGGIFKAVIVDKSAGTPGLVKFVVKGKNGSYGVTLADLPVRGFIILDPTEPGADCASATFPGGGGPLCAFNASGKTLKCK